MRGRFDKIVIIGYGKIAKDVLRHTAALQGRYGYRVTFVEHELNGMAGMENECGVVGAEHILRTDKKELTQTLIGISEPTLVISASNNYLFPESVIKKNNIEIINFHNALLPKLPGRNAPSWAIYLGEAITGATWHYVTKKVDGGDIIVQRETPVTGEIRAYELSRDIMVKAFEAFQGFFEELLMRHIDGLPQPRFSISRRMYHSWELPGGGICTVSDPTEDIYRMLRAMDYGKNDIFPPTRISLVDGRAAEVVRYRKEAAKHLCNGQKMSLDEETKRLYLAMEDGYELSIKFSFVDRKEEK